MGKVTIGGMKLSSELALIKLQHPPGKDPHQWGFWKKLTASRINLFFLSCACIGPRSETAFCVATQDYYGTKELIHSEKYLNGRALFTPEVGALSLFPHHFSFEILGLSLCAFGWARLPFYGLASSISSLTLMTDYALLEKAAATLAEYLALPDGQTPVKL